MQRAISFGCPDRLPMMLDSLGRSDVHWVNWNQVGSGDSNIRQTLDEWGCTWSRTEARNMGQVTGHPLEDWAALRDYRWPDPQDPGFYTGIEKQFDGSRDKFVLTKIFMLLFERLHSLHGFANTLADLALGDERLERLADRVVDFDLGIIENLAGRFPGRIHGLYFTDDWGTEQRTMISPKLWGEFFQPRYRRLFHAIHAAGWVVWMHSCGQISAIVDGLIEVGVDVLNLQQPRVFGIEGFGRRYAGRVAFETLCDIQKTLPFGGRQEIQREAQLLMKYWAVPEGGLILGDYGESDAIGVTPEKKSWMLDAFLAADRWKVAQ